MANRPESLGLCSLAGFTLAVLLQCTPQSASAHEANKRTADANALLGLMSGASVGVAYNIIGTMTVSVFTTIQFINPLDAVDEFDRWAAYTRQMIADQIKERLQ